MSHAYPPERRYSDFHTERQQRSWAGVVKLDPLSTKWFAAVPILIGQVLTSCASPERGHPRQDEVDVDRTPKVVVGAGIEVEGLVVRGSEPR
jgi:hypothetical protein